MWKFAFKKVFWSTFKCLRWLAYKFNSGGEDKEMQTGNKVLNCNNKGNLGLTDIIKGRHRSPDIFKN